MKTLFEQIEASAMINDLDEAVRPIQEILGQEDGGLAAQFFDDAFSVGPDTWPLMHASTRRLMLIRYCVFELGMKESRA